jgi:hypothetical protein
MAIHAEKLNWGGNLNSEQICVDAQQKEEYTKAEQHWSFLERWLRIVYIDSFVHGYKHGVEAERERNGNTNRM